MADASPAIVWFRQDLRLGDNPALRAAIDAKRPLILVYVLDDETPGRWRIGAAQRWWLHRSLEALGVDISKRGARLLLRRGCSEEIIARLAEETSAAAVFWNRCYEPFAIARDSALKATLTARGVRVESFSGALLNEPWTVQTKSGEPFKVFTPYWRACLAQSGWRAPLPAPRKLDGYAGALASDALSAWRLLPTRPNWAAGFAPEWEPGEAGAQAALERFLDTAMKTYSEARDQLGARGTSRLSPHLHWGELSPTQIHAAVEAAVERDSALRNGADKFMSEIGWREFSHNLLYHWPTLPEANWRRSFDTFPWREDEAGLEAWRRGRTGYPVVDAAMRELWTTGYMHNRARMIAASFLIKHLMLDWRCGEAWFWDTLLDADLASNAASWQWVAGSGADAAPYFRIFNPVTQGERYDASGAYVRRWVPELAGLPTALLHQPWKADAPALAAAGVRLGETYPRPIVEHGFARVRALAAFKSMSSEA